MGRVHTKPQYTKSAKFKLHSECIPRSVAKIPPSGTAACQRQVKVSERIKKWTKFLTVEEPCSLLQSSSINKKPEIALGYII
jgi:hypothetical protein